jgi:hypothetical protein
MADQSAKMAQRRGQDEYKTINDLYNAKKTALNDYLEVEYRDAEKLVAAEAARAAISRDGVAKKFNAEAVLLEKQNTIYAKYNKDWEKLEGNRVIAVEDANKMTISTMANLYKTIGDSSEESANVQIKQIERKYLEDGRYARHTNEQKIILEKAIATEIFNIRNKLYQDLLSLQLSVLEITGGQYTTAYKMTQDFLLNQQASLLENEMKNKNLSFDKDKWLAEKRKEILVKELEDKAAYYMAIGGMEDKAAQASLAAIELRRQKEVKVYGDSTASEKKATQDKVKLQNSIVDNMRSRYDEEHKFQAETIKNAISVFDNASALMNKESKEYQLMQDAKKAMQIAELAMTIQKNMAIISSYMAQQQSAASLAVTNAAASTTAQGSVPIAGFAMVAAMAAVMASVLAMAGIAGFSAGSSTAASSVSLPTSTVLGAANGTGSESITKSWELLKDTYDMEYHELRGIYNEMRDLNSSIKGLVTSIVRTGGVSGVSAATGSSTPGWWGMGSGEWTREIPMIGNIIAGVWNWVEKIGAWALGGIFGGGIESSVDMQGIQTSVASIRELLAGGSVGAQQFTHVTEKHDGGWFSSDWYSGYTVYGVLNENVSNMLDKVFKNMSNTLVELTIGLGTDMNTTLNYVFSGATMNLKGMDSEAINKYLTEYFSAMGDNAVQALFGTMLKGYQEVGEGLMETATRILVDKAIIVDTLAMTNQAYAGNTTQLIAFSESLIKMAGDLDTLRTAAESYYDKFFSDEEKQARLQLQLTTTLASYNMLFPTARAGYRALVEGLDLTTTAGQEAYIMLLKMAESADTYYSAAEDAAGGTDDLTESLKELSKTIDEWLDNLKISNLAPSVSADEWNRQYSEAYNKAALPAAAVEDVTDYLSFATKYLEFQKTYGSATSYQAMYDSVVADVMGIQQTTLGRYAEGTNYVPKTGPYTLHEGEIVVPAYQSQKIRSVNSAKELGAAIGDYILKSNGGSSGGDITISLTIDGREIGNVVAKQLKINGDLQQSVRSLN